MGYQELKNIFDEIHHLRSISSILHWDSETYLPVSSYGLRAKQLSLLENYRQSLLLSKEVSQSLTGIESDKLAEDDQRNLIEMQRQIKIAQSLPRKLLESLAECSGLAQNQWHLAREENDYALFQKPFKELLKRTQEKAHILSNELQLSPFGALFSLHEASISEADLGKIFIELENELPNKVEQLMDREKNIQPKQFSLKSKKEDLVKLIVKILTRIGFDFNHGRLDATTHPFSEGTKYDVRIAINYNEEDWTSTLMGAVHELGHALYDQHLPSKWQGQPLGEDAGMSVHESQALLFEMFIGRSREFIDFIYPLVNDYLGKQNASAEDIYWHLNHVQKSLIRIDADFTTYPLHILIRYKLELALLNDELDVASLPDAWDEYTNKFLGLKATNLKEGCLQDIHWAMGYWGYFPTYHLGSMLAAKLFNQMEAENTNLKAQIANGNFAEIIQWLDTKIYSQGKKYSFKL